MKKISAVLCASLCLFCAVTAVAENPTELAPAPDHAVMFEGATDPVVDEIANQVGSIAANEADIAPIAPAPTESSEYNLVSEDEIIVNYASSEEELPKLDVLFWTVAGVLVLGCLLIFAYKIIQKRRMR